MIVGDSIPCAICSISMFLKLVLFRFLKTKFHKSSENGLRKESTPYLI